jgi:misacylated tRNA(Ala) deacylase
MFFDRMGATMTTELYLDDAYLRTCHSVVTHVDGRGIQLEQTPFYALGGGQPADRGELVRPDGRRIQIVSTVRDRETGDILHVPAEGSAVDLRTGDTVTATIEWDLRYAHMRCHTCLHLLCALIPFPVTGGSVRAGSGRLDFDIPQPILDKEELTAKLNELIARNAPVSFEYISEAELRGKPELVRTLEVGPPARGGKIRLVRIEGIDLQPCGGSHLRSTGEIGRARVVKMEKKGRQNRRVEVAIEDA